MLSVGWLSNVLPLHHLQNYQKCIYVGVCERIAWCWGILAECSAQNPKKNLNVAGLMIGLHPNTSHKWKPRTCPKRIGHPELFDRNWQVDSLAFGTFVTAVIFLPFEDFWMIFRFFFRFWFNRVFLKRVLGKECTKSYVGSCRRWCTCRQRRQKK